MAHNVELKIPPRDLGKADIEFNVKKDGSMLGTLKVSKGAVVWREANDTYGKKLSWTKLAELFKNYGSAE